MQAHVAVALAFWAFLSGASAFAALDCGAAAPRVWEALVWGARASESDLAECAPEGLARARAFAGAWFWARFASFAVAAVAFLSRAVLASRQWCRRLRREEREIR